MRIRIAVPLALAPVVLSACTPADTDPGPGGVTVDEAKALDEAAAMLDERRLPAEALPGAAPSARETPEFAGED